MVATCPHCKKRYRIDPQRLPASGAVLKCAACGKRFRVGGSKPQTSEAPAGGFLRIECPGCGQQYKIPKNKIPAGRKTLTCRICEETILLGPPKPLVPVPAPEDEPQPPSHDEGPDFAAQLLAVLGTRRARRIALVLGVVLLLMVIVPPLLSEMAAVGGRVSRNVAESLSNTLSGIKDKPAAQTNTSPSLAQARPAPDATEPILSLSIQGKVAMDALKTLPEGADLATLLASLQVKKICFWLCPDAEQTVMPALAVETGRAPALAALFEPGGPWAPYVKPAGPGCYEFDKAAVVAALPQSTDRKWQTLPLEQYAIHVIGRQTIIAPRTISAVLEEHPDHLSRCRVASLIEPIQSTQDCLCLAIDCIHGLAPGWQQALLDNAFVKNCPGLGSATLARSLAAVFKQHKDPFAKITRLALAYHAEDDASRRVTYTQTFAAQVDGEAIYRSLQQEHRTVDDRAAGLPRLAAAVYSLPFLKRCMEFEENQLTVHVTWVPDDDQQIVPYIRNVLWAGEEPSSGDGLASPAGDPGIQGRNLVTGAVDSLFNTLFSRTIVPREGSRIYDVTRALLTLKTVRNQNHRHYGEDLASLYFVQQRGKLLQLIPLELALADSTAESQRFFGYAVEPYRGYTFQPLSTQPFTPQTLIQWRRTEGQRFPWTGTRLKHLTVKSVPNLVAIPAEDTDPIFVYCYETDKIYLKHHQESTLTCLPADLSLENGWVVVDMHGIIPDGTTGPDSGDVKTEDKDH